MPEEVDHLTTDELYEVLAGYTLRAEAIEAEINKNK